MSTDMIMPPDAGSFVARFRAAIGATQSQLAQFAGIDQSRVSRIEKGEPATAAEVKKALDALAGLGSADAREYLEFVDGDWTFLERPAFDNPQRAAIELAESTLWKVNDFLQSGDHPWPLRRQLERQRDLLMGSAGYLLDHAHQIAFIGDIGVGKSTAISVLFNLLAQQGEGGRLGRVVLETGSGRTTICEVHIRRGPEYGIAVQAQADSEVRALVSDFCAQVWTRVRSAERAAEEAVQVSEEVGRAIRNMAGLTIRRERLADGTRASVDLAVELCKASPSEEEFRARVLEAMNLAGRTRREVWFSPSTGKGALAWMAETFKAVNNGRLADVPLPRIIDLMLPDFAQEQSPLALSIVDTKGVDDVAIRPDLDARLKDPRTVVVLCSSFNDAPSTTVRLLLEHLDKAYGMRVDTGRINILALPRPEEALKVKDLAGNAATDDEDGYELKREQIDRTLGGAEGLVGKAPVLFFNAASDDPALARAAIFAKVGQVRRSYAERVLELAATVDDLISRHESHAVTAAVEEVAARLRHFLGAHRALKARERQAYAEVLQRVGEIRYASTLWASTRRGGEWPSFDVCHLLGNGAAQDALLRSRDWFTLLKGTLATLKADPGLKLAERLLGQIEASADGWRRDFAEAARNAGAEVYREPIQHDNGLWSACAGEWGQGSGFKVRVSQRLQDWFDGHGNLKDQLEGAMNALWEATVIRRLEALCEEDAAEPAPPTASNVVQLAPRG